MTPIELQECMNVYITLWKSMVQGPEHRDSLYSVWKDRGFLNYDKDLFIKALYLYEDTSEKNYLAPRPKQIMDAYKTVKARERNSGERRIVTPEEVMYEIYLKEMEKPTEKRNEDLVRRCLPAARLFNDPEAYRKHFGKTREEYEKY